jgi:PBP1b-binding outer membrane lipoprotein LpoB
MEESTMKKVLLLTLVAMMLLSMFVMSACKPKAEEAPVDEAAPVEEVTPAPVDTTQAPATEAAPAATTPAPAGK